MNSQDPMEIISTATPELSSTNFSPEKKKIIMEHLLITKRNTTKNYQHVPCKFFKQGNCSAGDHCLFSHSIDLLQANNRPCKYYKLGNCKFGNKCANAHIDPDQNTTIINNSNNNCTNQPFYNDNQNILPLPNSNNLLNNNNYNYSNYHNNANYNELNVPRIHNLSNLNNLTNLTPPQSSDQNDFNYSTTTPANNPNNNTTNFLPNNLDNYKSQDELIKRTTNFLFDDFSN